MAAAAPATAGESEREFLEGLRHRYEEQGFAFTVAPGPAVLPEFLLPYRPDAVAQKPGQNIAIEVRSNQSPSTQARLQEVRRLFEGHPDWQLHVLYKNAGPLQSITIPTPAPAALRRQIAEIRTLNAHGHQRAAFVIAWSLLEASLQLADDAEAGKPRTPGTVVQALAMNGLISPELENRLRSLIPIRNRIVHGDVAAEPTADDVDLVLQAVEDALTVES